MINLKINDKPVQALKGSTVLQAALSAGINIAHLCYDEILGINGKCNLCFVQLKDVKAPVLACQTEVGEGMEVFTQTEEVRELIRENAQKLLKSHPADCALCLKGGACAIQRICTQYRPEIEISYQKANSENLKEWIKISQDKCIHCGRCLSFLKKAGVKVKKETTPIEDFPFFHLSGTLTDLCPAGALSRGNLDQLIRPWEMKTQNSIDVTDATGSGVEIKTFQGKIVDVRPQSLDRLISDKARFCLDGLRYNRLDRPYVRIGSDLKECSWTEAFVTIASKIKDIPPDKIGALVGNYADCESMLALKDIFSLLGASSIDAGMREMMTFDLDSRQSWLFNTPFDRIKEADALLAIGTRISEQAPGVDWIIHNGNIQKALIGEDPFCPSDYEQLSASPVILQEILDGNGRGALFLKQAEKPMIVVGPAVLQRKDALALLDVIYRICIKYGVIRDDWNGYNFLHEKATLIAALELGMVSKRPLKPRLKAEGFEFVYLLNEDDISRDQLEGAFVVYQGIFASSAAQAADVILPSLAFTEKRATYVDMQGRAQSTAIVSPSFGLSREDWKILRALSEHLGITPLPYNDLDGIRDYLAGENIIFYERGEIHKAGNEPFGRKGEIDPAALKIDVDVFNDELSRQSQGALMLKQEVGKR